MREQEKIAIRIATEAHAGQKYGDAPFITHPAAVAREASYWNFPSVVRVAAWLHDVLEDTELTERALRENGVSEEVILLVKAVTDEPGKNRKERHLRTYPKIKKAGENAIALKLCDRIANVRACLENGNEGLFKMYRKEHEEFKEALHEPGNLTHPWLMLDILLYSRDPGGRYGRKI